MTAAGSGDVLPSKIKDDRMQFQKLISLSAMCVASVLFSTDVAFAQGFQPLGSVQQYPSRTQQKVPASNVSQEASAQRPGSFQLPQFQQAEPYKITSRFHLEEGTYVGYLVVKVELPIGSYIHSLTQPAPMQPTEIKVQRSSQFRLDGPFLADRPATVIEKDPVFNQRLEKHVGDVQFFVPVEFAPGTDIKKVAAQISLNGQVCTDAGTCMQVSGVKTLGKFAGYFGRVTSHQAPATRTASQPQLESNLQIR
ncbi:MAG: hypothetical protein ACI87E_003727 [Mariniblastus sp.]|jgi:hypothetical protein